METSKIKTKLKENGLDAYVMYDFRGSNFSGRKILNFNGMTTRKFASVLGKDGVFHIVSKMESQNYISLSGKILTYTTYQEFEGLLEKTIKKYKTIALDISKNNSLPIVDLAPYGFVELIEKINPGVKIVSSENFTQSLAASWGKKGYLTHKVASKELTQIFEKTFEFVRKNIKKGGLTDFKVMEYVVDLQKKAGLHSDGENVCIIASGADSNNPHYWPKKENPHKIRKNAPLLVDMWARTKDTGSIYADFTMYGWVGPQKPPKIILDAWEIWKEARDTGVFAIKEVAKKEGPGFEVDKKVRGVFEKKGFLKYLLHRSGHSLGEKEHGNGANLDDFETHDTRHIMPDTGMTIEPGIYMKEYGVRGEIDLYVHPDKKVEVTTPLQDGIIIV